MRKAIIKWLLGADWERYWDLHDKYREELSEHRMHLEKLIEVEKKLLKEKEEHLTTLNRDLLIIEDNRKLAQICKANGIETTEEDYLSLN